MHVILYSKPNCGPCRATEHALNNLARGGALTYEKIDVSQDAEAMAFVSGTLGYRSVPVVYCGADDHWQGFDYERLMALRVDREPENA